jgi:hypothetical protein
MIPDTADLIRTDPDNQLLGELVRNAYDAELFARVEDSVERQLDVFFAIDAVPSRKILAVA